MAQSAPDDLDRRWPDEDDEGDDGGDDGGGGDELDAMVHPLTRPGRKSKPPVKRTASERQAAALLGDG